MVALSIAAGRNVEVGISSIEVEVNSVTFRDCGFPRKVILVGVEGMDGICPSIIKSFDLLIVFFLSDGYHQIFILNNSSVSKSDLILAGIDLVDSNVVRLSVVFAEGLSGGCSEIEFGDAE